MLEDGDATETGAQGVSLSDGQKAQYDTPHLGVQHWMSKIYTQCCSAHAVYARTKYVLLDDPLSAVVCTLPDPVSRMTTQSM